LYGRADDDRERLQQTVTTAQTIVEESSSGAGPTVPSVPVVGATSIISNPALRKRLLQAVLGVAVDVNSKGFFVLAVPSVVTLCGCSI
jgi:hypothetical protein